LGAGWTMPRTLSRIVRPGQPLLAWLIILGLVGFVLWRNGTSSPQNESNASLALVQMQARYLVGVMQLGSPVLSAEAALQQADGFLDQPDNALQLRRAVLIGELRNSEAALNCLRTLRQRHQDGEIEPFSEASEKVAALLERLYAGYLKRPGDASSLSSDEQAYLRQSLGWFGELALAPAAGDLEARQQVLGQARRTLFRTLGFFALGCVAFVLGCGVLAFLAASLLTLQIRAGKTLMIGRPLPTSGWGGVYAETFALYLLLYLFLSWLLASGRQLWLSGLAMIGSLSALIWPVWRGVPLKQLAEDLGLTRGASLVIEILCGIACYLAALPLLVVGVLLMFGLMLLSRQLGLEAGSGAASRPPTHPVVGLALQGGLWLWVQLFVVAAVLAPLVEEVFFRGVLYSHLREAMGRFGSVVSVLLATLLSSFLFAVIHPQGWLAVPVLMALAIAFSLAREWRGSLIAPMVAHACNNGAVSALLVLIAS